MLKMIPGFGTALCLFALPALADEARTPPAQPYYAPAAPDCEAINLKVYFETGTAELTPFARDAIRETREQVSGCAVTKIDATTKAADASSESDRLALAEARRAVLVNMLKAHDFKAGEVNLQTDVSGEPSTAVMSRNSDIRVETQQAGVS